MATIWCTIDWLDRPVGVRRVKIKKWPNKYLSDTWPNITPRIIDALRIAMPSHNTTTCWNKKAYANSASQFKSFTILKVFTK
jgi:hypothetical protein